ncbi:MAG: Nucleoside-triphosphatase THEP1 [Anaerolineales bacterium]|nr:Nucleoside-triphosphatase THEP1 [Anaerolineales bacterium]
MPKAILLTGRPGVGKTTVVRRVVERLGQPAGGFYTRELREGGRRVGFEIVTLGGQTATLSHVDIESRQRVSKYGVDVAALDRVGVPGIRRAVKTDALVVVDEIGKMELFSDAFKQAVLDALESESSILGTITQGRHPWANRIKQRDDVEVLKVTVQNRDALVDQLVGRLGHAE